MTEFAHFAATGIAGFGQDPIEQWKLEIMLGAACDHLAGGVVSQEVIHHGGEEDLNPNVII